MLIKAGEKTFPQNRFVSGSQVIQAMSLVLKERSSSYKQNQILFILAVDIYSQTEKIKHKKKRGRKWTKFEVQNENYSSKDLLQVHT